MNFKFPAMDYQIEAGKPRLFLFHFHDYESQESQETQQELVNWFWDGYLLIAHWFETADFSSEYYELPQVQEFLLCFALYAQDALHRMLDDETVYSFLRLCEDTHDAILAHYHRPR